ncbi:MAG TPA: hypothetical protein VIJ93_00910, partial [bacterium]
NSGSLYWGDLIYFNSDGSLDSEGALSNGSSQIKPQIVLPPLGGWVSSTSPNSSTLISVNFGTGGMLGYGLQDGLTGNSAPSIIN